MCRCIIRQIPRSRTSGSKVTCVYITFTDTTTKLSQPQCVKCCCFSKVLTIEIVGLLDFRAALTFKQERKRKEKFLRRGIWTASRIFSLTSLTQHLQFLKDFFFFLLYPQDTITGPKRSTALLPHQGPHTGQFPSPLSFQGKRERREKREEPGRERQLCHWGAPDGSLPLGLCASQLPHLQQVSVATHKPNGGARSIKWGSCRQMRNAASGPMHVFQKRVTGTIL